MTGNSAMIAAWFDVMEWRLHIKATLGLLLDHQPSVSELSKHIPTGWKSLTSTLRINSRKCLTTM
jgi:hypothetical protein